MLTKMEVFSSSQLLSSTFTFDEDGNANLDKIQIHTVDGLDPVKASVNTTQYGSIDGTYFTGSSVTERNIVITVGFHPDWVDYAIEDLRQPLYLYFMPKQTVDLQFESTHLPTVSIAGIVESMTPNLFSQDPEIQISIICPDPNFYALEADTQSGPAATIAANTTVPIVYSGSVDTAVQITVKSSVATPSYTGPVYVMNTGFEVQSFIVPSLLIDSTAYLNLDTDDGARDVSSVAVSTGIKTNLMGTIGVVDWIKLKPGLNNLAVLTTGGGQTWELIYVPKFGGL
jgi:hypothetical protein